MNTAPETMSAKAPRIESVDLLRGLIMVVMALDHVRDYFHFGAIQGADPLDLATTTPWIFFTRWITNYCAPLFSFLAGTGTYFSVIRGKPKRELSWFLVTRGLWLIFLELTIFVWFGWKFAITPNDYILATLWALGWGMIVLAGLIHLPEWVVAAFGLALILGHNAFDGVKPADLGALAPLWVVVHTGGRLALGTNITVLAFYPLVPWVGVMAAGYSFGAIYRLEPMVRRRWLFRLGLALTIGFVALRYSNLYGNPSPWVAQRNPLFTVLSFLDCQKYPPSLCYLLMTVGPGLLLLAWFEGGTPALLRPFIVFGRVPMFYYLLHVPLIHGLSVLLNRIRFGGGDFNAIAPSGPPPADAGVSLVATCVIWILIVAALYPACRWFADLKRRRREAWLTYF